MSTASDNLPSGTDMQSAILDQITALNDAANAIQALPVFDSNSFNAVNGMEQNLESLYAAYQYDPGIPDITSGSLASLQNLVAKLEQAITSSSATSHIILGLAQAVGAFRGVAVSAA